MIGKFLVCEGIMTSRFIVREVVGETAQFWVLRNCRNLDEKKAKKASLGPHRFFDGLEDAQSAADQITAKLLGAQKHFQERRRQIIDGLIDAPGGGE